MRGPDVVLSGAPPITPLGTKDALAGRLDVVSPLSQSFPAIRAEGWTKDIIRRFLSTVRGGQGSTGTVVPMDDRAVRR